MIWDIRTSPARIRKNTSSRKRVVKPRLVPSVNARRKMDKTGKDANKNGKADKREGKDIAHKKALSKGGKNKDGVTVQSRKKNRAAGGAMSSPKRRKS